MNALDLIDTDVYPLDATDSPAFQAAVARARDAFVTNGVALLPKFLTSKGLAAMTADVVPLAPKAYFCRNEHNVYLDRVYVDHADPAVGVDHPRNRQLRTNVGSVANDYLDPDGPLQQLYKMPELAAFIAPVVGAEQLHLSADPLGAVSVNVFAPGDAHDWHFDESLFTVTLMVQPAESGGHFEYVRGLRPDHDDGDVGAINRCLDGSAEPPTRMRFEPGTLSIFAGRHTMHRVTTVGGDQPRLVPVLTFSETPGYRNSDAVRALFWGRTE